jgi:hypothetical protein
MLEKLTDLQGDHGRERQLIEAKEGRDAHGYRAAGRDWSSHMKPISVVEIERLKDG